ncbi:MAG: RNA polymerase sporulation sigma factor SigK [Clostridia bacterium]|nr:RNA polymerase sporulation sigma factor SigK [Clostridia bacterium]MDD4686154.1 RNA polymerase sporulation sigma factor SigK [Clostridia bacterium]
MSAQDIVLYVCGNDALPLPLNSEEERVLLEELAKNNMQARDKLIEHNLRLVVYIAKKFENTKLELEDLISVGAIGLIKAIKTFNYEKQIKLATYASRCIENEILMQLRKSSKQKLEVSLDEPLNYDSEGNELLLSDILSNEEDNVSKNLELDAEKQILWQSLDKLCPREQEIMKLRFGLAGKGEKTQKQVADLLGISQSYISRIEKKILGKIKTEIQKVSNL